MKEFFTGLAKSFLFAFNGVKFAVTHERNFRVHIIAIIYTLVFAAIYGLPTHDYAVLVLTFALVLSFELINTALENVVNIKTESFSRYAKTAKDTAAAAVLISALAAIGVAISLFSDTEKLSAAFSKIFSVPNVIWFILSLVPAFAFVAFCRSKEKTDKESKDI